jgi:outer membrane protein assembly factor BamD (BamD/ComL family)
VEHDLRGRAAKEKLSELLKKYPDSLEAKKAAEVLAKLNAAQ